MSVYRCTTCQFPIMTRGCGNSYFQFSPLFKFFVQFSTSIL